MWEKMYRMIASMMTNTIEGKNVPNSVWIAGDLDFLSSEKYKEINKHDGWIWARFSSIKYIIFRSGWEIMIGAMVQFFLKIMMIVL
jgi:hypothetical protein